MILSHKIKAQACVYCHTQGRLRTTLSPVIITERYRELLHLDNREEHYNYQHGDRLCVICHNRAKNGGYVEKYQHRACCVCKQQYRPYITSEHKVVHTIRLCDDTYKYKNGDVICINCTRHLRRMAEYGQCQQLAAVHENKHLVVGLRRKRTCNRCNDYKHCVIVKADLVMKFMQFYDPDYIFVANSGICNDCRYERLTTTCNHCTGKEQLTRITHSYFLGYNVYPASSVLCAKCYQHSQTSNKRPFDDETAETAEE